MCELEVIGLAAACGCRFVNERISEHVTEAEGDGMKGAALGRLWFDYGGGAPAGYVD